MATQENITLSGMSISAGLAVGRAFVFQDIFERELQANWNRLMESTCASSAPLKKFSAT